jgi:translation elongation factor P/translation initiation factor 5A
MKKRKLLKINKLQYESVVKDFITQNGLNVQYSYTKDHFYLFSDESTINQLETQAIRANL